MSETRIDSSGVMVSCPQCGRSNRLRFAALGQAARCGQCKTPLPPPSSPIAVGDAATFEAAAVGALPLIVDFWAAWCGPCRMVAPELERVARAQAGRYLVVKVDTDAVSDLSARFRIQSIPTLAVVQDGREIARTAGVRPAAEIEAFAEKALAGHHRRAS